MTKTARSTRSDAEAEGAWKAAQEGDREAFQAAVRPYLGELLRGARHEVRYRVALGDFRADDPTAEELAGEVLIRAWQKRHDRHSALRLRVWLLALLVKNGAAPVNPYDVDQVPHAQPAVPKNSQ